MMGVVIFDAYGTLWSFDALENTVYEIIGDATISRQFTSTWRQKQMEYAWTSMLMNRYQDFDKLTELALQFARNSVSHDISDDAVQNLLQAYATLPLYDDVAQGLEQLESNHKLAVLSNGTFRSLQTLANEAGVLFSFDYILSVEPIRNYKPARPVYQLVLDTFNCEKSDVTFVSSNDWDITGAKAFGFRTIWLNRTAKSSSPIQPQADLTVKSFDEVVAHLTKTTV